jgi:predicted ArsR family transcriptional regulator
MNSIKDEIFNKSLNKHLITVGFIKALENNLDPKLAYDIASEAFSNYMKEYYRIILGSTEKGSQERFDTFRKHYERYSTKSSYIQIVESTSRILRIKFNRCPFSEVMEEFGLSKFTHAFCLSDLAFTRELLPGVTFQRDHVIAEGDSFCNHSWKLFLKL